MKNIINVALYGGAFDPPHKSHLSIANQLLNIQFINQVWLLPSGDRNDKKLILPMNKRFQLLDKLLNDYGKKVKLVDEQIKLSKQLNRMIPTFQLINYLNKIHESHCFYFVVGGDILTTINTWQNAKQLLQNVNFIIFPRKGFSFISQIMPKYYYLSPFIPQQISSSQIKNVLLNQDLSKQQKYQKIKDYLQKQTLQMLKQFKYI